MINQSASKKSKNEVPDVVIAAKVSRVFCTSLWQLPHLALSNEATMRLVHARQVLDDLPNVLSGMAKFAARDAGTETVIANANRVVLVLVCECIGAFRHRTNEDADAFGGPEILEVITHTYDRCIER